MTDIFSTVIPILISIFCSVLVIFFNTKNDYILGWRKITKSGWIIFTLNIVLLIVSLSSYYIKQKDIQNYKVSAISELAKDLHAIEMLYSDAKYEDNRNYVLAKLNISYNSIKDNINLNSNYLDKKVVDEMSGFLKLLDSEKQELINKRNFINKKPLTELSVKANKFRYKYCNEVLKESFYCSYLQGDPTGVEFFKHDDKDMMKARSDSLMSLPVVINHFSWIKKNNATLMVKIPLPQPVDKNKKDSDDDIDEHYDNDYIWVRVFQVHDGYLLGLIANDTESKYGHFGQFVKIYGEHYIYNCDYVNSHLNRVKKGDFIYSKCLVSYSKLGVSDWIIIYKGITYGNYTFRAYSERLNNKYVDDYNKQLSKNADDVPW